MIGRALAGGSAIGSLTVEFAPVPLWMHLILEDPMLDPILLGAHGYGDTVFTTRLVSKTD